jgi:hypothetical protein
MRAVIAALMLLTASVAQAEPAAFAKLKALVGNWEAEVSPGKKVKVSYRLVANDTVLVQTWATTTSKETMTMFHPDGDGVILTHYCFQGNQPRLRFDAKASTDKRLVFTFADVTNLARPEASRMVKLELALDGDSRYTETSTYVEDGKPDVSSLRFQRVRQ